MKNDFFSALIMWASQTVAAAILGWLLDIDGKLFVIFLVLNILFTCAYVISYRHKHKKEFELLSTLGNQITPAGIDKLSEISKLMDKYAIEEPAQLECKLVLLKQLNDNGIIGCHDNLAGTPFQPSECIRNLNRSLSFMGVTGSKWIVDPQMRGALRAKLRQIANYNNARMRFLLIDPESNSFQRLKNICGSDLTDDSYQYWKELQKEFKDCLEVKLYDHIPSFRLQFIDNQILTVSRYRIDRADNRNAEYGLNAPHLIVKDRDGRGDRILHYWSLYEAFQLLYQHIWDDAKQLL